ncbi:DNA repair protein RadC [Virgibacillus indicus]|uniref:DNA repair protein RadC n=1 Tax=Virgibacillus indicus TaxID=2024554 RepID=A0A265NC79_9BACI|nr:DNA repair protein RadC [Virgibacillus indicus]OZU89064.1 DNA repair protein RadC [Virgibacillus indicus]
MNAIEKAREAVTTYDSIGDHGLVSNHDVLSVILGPSANTDIVQKLSDYPLNNLVDMTIEEIKGEGLTHNQALTLHAAFLLSKRCRTGDKNHKYTIRSPEDAADYMMEEMRHLKQEHFVAVYLDTKNQVIHKKIVFIGSLNASIVHPRELFREAVKRSAASIIALHNHPSGSPTPSQEDIHVTRRLVESGKMIGIEILDHIIIGDRKFVSLKEKGYL